MKNYLFSDQLTCILMSVWDANLQNFTYLSKATECYVISSLIYVKQFFSTIYTQSIWTGEI